jgi:ribosome-binding factor A
VLGGEVERKKSLAALQQASGFVRRELGKRLRIRHTPEIDFRYDKGLDATDRVARLLEAERLRGLAEAGDEQEPADAAEAGSEDDGKPE